MGNRNTGVVCEQKYGEGGSVATRSVGVPSLYICMGCLREKNLCDYDEVAIP